MKERRSNKNNKQKFDNLEYSREADLINQDLITKILLRVSAKSLMRFKCVSKRWLSLVSDPIFCSKHARQNSNPLVWSNSYLYHPYYRLPFESITILDRTQSFLKLDFLVDAKIVDSCNGLILFYNFRIGYEVCNPTTRKFKTILPNTCVDDSHFMCQTSLVFDPLKSNQYKVVQFLHNIDDDLDEIHIYSTENSSWKSMHITTVAQEYQQTANKFYWNEALNCLTLNSFHFKFDFDTEELSSTPLQQFTENHKVKYLGSCQRRLILVFCPLSDHPKHYSDRPSFTVLEMKSNTNHWIVKYRIKLSPQPMNQYIPHVYYVIFGNNDDEVWLILSHHRNEIVLLGSNGKTLQVLKDIFLPVGVVQLIETLSPV